MILFGGVAALVGVVLFHVALRMTLRANPKTRIPFNRNAAIIPGGSVAMRVIGAGLIVLGAVLLSTSGLVLAFHRRLGRPSPGSDSRHHSQPEGA